MLPEQEYRQLLSKAQQSAQCIEHFLDAISKSPRTRINPSIQALLVLAKSHGASLEVEIDQIWDEFKRTNDAAPVG